MASNPVQLSKEMKQSNEVSDFNLNLKVSNLQEFTKRLPVVKQNESLHKEFILTNREFACEHYTIQMIEEGSVDKLKKVLTTYVMIPKDRQQVVLNKGLLFACEKDSTDIISVLLEAGAQPSCERIEDGSQFLLFSPLFVAASRGKINNVKCLLEAYPDLLKQKKHMGISFGYNVLMAAARNGQIEMLRFLHELDNDLIRKTLPDGYTVFMAAADGIGDVKTLQLLYKSMPIYLNYQDQFGITALHCASRNGHLTAVRYLVSLGAKFNVLDKAGKTPQKFAMEAGHEEVANYFKRLEELFECARRGNIQRMQVLQKSGFPLETRDRYGRTPMHLAYAYNQTKMVIYLIDEGVDQDCRDDKNRRPIQVATEKRHVECVVFSSKYIIESFMNNDSVDQKEKEEFISNMQESLSIFLKEVEAERKPDKEKTMLNQAQQKMLALDGQKNQKQKDQGQKTQGQKRSLSYTNEHDKEEGRAKKSRV